MSENFPLTATEVVALILKLHFTIGKVQCFVLRMTKEIMQTSVKINI